MYGITRKIFSKTIHFFSSFQITEAKESSFHPTLQQKEFIERNSFEDCKVLGISGSGKTLSILSRVNHLIEQKCLNPSNIHILTFSKPTRIDLLDKIHLHKYEKILQNNVKTIDSLARSVLKETNKNFQNLSLLSLNFNSLLESEFQLAQPYIENLKYLFIDEAQDLRDIQINILKLLKEKNQAKICLVGDPCQSIYQFIDCDPSFLLNYSAETFYLTKNFRSTDGIIAFSQYFRNKDIFPLKEEKEDASVLKIQKKKKNIEIYTGTSRQVERKILKEISDYPGDKDNIAILSPLIKSKLSSNMGLSWASNILIKNRIPFSKQYKESGGSSWNSNPKKNQVNLTTYIGSKGREWDFVILLDFSLFKHGILPNFKEYIEDLNLYYVAITRAKSKLLIIHKNDTGLSINIQNKEEIKDLNHELEEKSINMHDILMQFREADKSVKKFFQEGNDKLLVKDETMDNDDFNNKDIILKNMIHPVTKKVDAELYESKKKTREYIENLKFDQNWLEKDNVKKTQESMTVTELLASLNDRGLSNLFDNPNFSYEVQKEKVYEKVKLNLFGIQNNETLAGIISENLLCYYLGVPFKDYIEKLSKKDYIVCDDYQTINIIKNLVSENKSWTELQQMLRQKKLSSKVYNFLKKHFEEDKEFLQKFFIHSSTDKVIFTSLNFIKKVNEFRLALLKKEVSFEPQIFSDEFNKNIHNANFYIVFNSIIQFSFASGHNDYILKAWYATKNFLEDNKQYISNIKILSNKLLEKNIFWESQVPVSYNTHLKGSIDLLDQKQNVYEIKATKSITRSHILQSLLYSLMIAPKTRQSSQIQCSSSLINLVYGEIHFFKFSFSQKLLNEFLETFVNQNRSIIKFPVYFYEVKAETINNKLYVYYLAIRNHKTQSLIFETFIKYPNYFPRLDSSEDLNQYNCAPIKLKVEKILNKLVENNKQAVFISLPGCDEKGDLLGHILHANPTIIDGTGLMKLLVPIIENKKQLRALYDFQSSEEINENADLNNKDKLLFFSKAASINPRLLKDYIQEYCISFYI